MRRQHCARNSQRRTTMVIGRVSKTAAVFVVGISLVLSFVFTTARSAEQPSLLYATAEAGTKLVAFSLESNTVRTIGNIGYPFSLSLAFCSLGRMPYTIANTFDPAQAQLATLNLGRG